MPKKKPASFNRLTVPKARRILGKVIADNYSDEEIGEIIDTFRGWAIQGYQEYLHRLSDGSQDE